MIILNVPALTEERRRDLVKKVKAEGEHAKVGIRNNRKEAMDYIKKLKTRWFGGRSDQRHRKQKFRH